MGSHSVPATRHKWARPALTPASQAGTRFTYPGGMEGWVDVVARKRRRRESNSRPLGPESNALTTEPPSNIEYDNDNVAEFNCNSKYATIPVVDFLVFSITYYFRLLRTRACLGAFDFIPLWRTALGNFSKTVQRLYFWDAWAVSADNSWTMRTINTFQNVNVDLHLKRTTGPPLSHI